MEEAVSSTPSACMEGTWEASKSPPVDEDDFHRLMDEHGIIGLGEAEEEQSVCMCKDQPSPDSLALEDLSHQLRELMDSETLSQSLTEDTHPLALYDLETRDSDSVDEDLFSEEEEDRSAADQAESKPKRDGQLERTAEELDTDVGVWPDLQLPRKREESAVTSRPVEGEANRGALYPVPSPDGGAGGGSGTPGSTVPPELVPKAQQINQRAMGSETNGWNWSELVLPSYPMPDPWQVNQLPCELPCPTVKDPPKTRLTPARLKACHSQHSWDSESHRPRRTSTESKGNPNLDGSRRGRLSHPLPDFSKVKPKVCFPKRGYRPPKSKGSALCRALGAGPPATPKSPADIVKEVLMSSTEGPRAPESPSHPGATVPPEFASPQQAHALMNQLQEDYNRLLTKYAEAENTIDRLRLEAKVNLYSDPLEPRHSVCLGTVNQGSKAINLTFPQAQRAEIGHTAVQLYPSKFKSDGTDGASPPSRSLDRPGQQHLTEALTGQSDSFQMQVDLFEDSVKNGKLAPFQQMEGLSDLSWGLDALERAYLQARDEHRVLQQHGREPEAFDPDRQLEGQVFRLGMRLEELREQLGQTAPHQPHATAPYLPPSRPDPLSVQYHMENPPPLPQTSVFPMEGGAMSPLRGEAGPQSAALHSKLWMKHQQVECDICQLPDHFKELPGLLGVGHGSEVTGSIVVHPSVLRADTACRGNGRVASQEGERSTPPVLLKETGGGQSGLPPAHSSRSLESHLPRPLPHPHPRGLDQQRGMAPQGSTLQSGHRRAPPLDGVVSPETDSGFVGSESSRLTPVVHSPPHRMSRARRLSHRLGEAETNLQPPPVQPTLSSGSTRPPSRDHTGGYSHAPPPRGESKLPFPCPSKSDSPQHWDGSGIRVTPGTSESDIEYAPSVCVEEQCQADCTPPLTTEQPFGQQSPFPTASHRRDAPIGVQLTDRHEAVQSLQVEMSLLREGLEASLRQAPTVHPTQEGPPRPSIRFARPPKYRGGSQQVKQKAEERSWCEEESVGPAYHRRSSSTPCWGPELSITPDSEHSEKTSKLSSSRNIPASPPARGVRGWTRSDPVSCRGSGRLCDPAQSNSCDEHDSRETHSSAGPPSRSHQNACRWGAVGGAALSSRCPLCGGTEQLHGARETRGSGSSRKRHSGPNPKGNRPMKTLHKSASMAAAPPSFHSTVPVVHCVPVCSSVLCHPSPLLNAGPTYLHALYQPLGGTKTDTRDTFQEGHRQPGSSLSSDPDSVNQSLSRAIEAATSMRTASRHMARSLASGFRHQGPLAQSCQR